MAEIVDEMLYKYYHTVEEARFNLSRFVKLLVGDYANVQAFRPEAGQIERSEEYAYDETFESDMVSTLSSIFGGGSIKVQGGIISLDEFYKGV